MSFVSAPPLAKTVHQAPLQPDHHPLAGDTVPDLPYPLWSTGPDAELLASRDRRNDELVFPCVPPASPLSAAHDTVAIEPTGTLYSFTVIHPGPKTGEAPHALGFVDLPGPVRIFGRLQGAGRPAIGGRYRAQADERCGLVFVALDA
jgi:hypothetical protein